MNLPAYSLVFLNWICCISALNCWTCENAISPEECLKSGYSGRCAPSEKVCQTEVRYSVGWGETPIIRTGCKEQLACGNNFVQNPRSAWFPTQCNKGKFNSVCRCCCKGDFCNREILMCENVLEGLHRPTPSGREDSPQKQSKTTPPEEPLCQKYPDEPIDGSTSCDDGGRSIGGTCTFTCKDGYRLVGSAYTTCIRMGTVAEWSIPAPTCEKYLECEKLSELVNGRMECHGHGEIGTECSFLCDNGYTMHGPHSIRCENTSNAAKWSRNVPSCLDPDIQCPPLGRLRFGTVTCSHEDNRIGTKCEMQCSEEAQRILPSERLETECVAKEGKPVWSRRKPCCSSECLPTIRRDIVVAIDSSRSISNKEWNIMKNFVAEVISNFEVTQNTVQFAVYRFNGQVDTKSQILFGDYANLDELVHSVNNLPKNGGGTRIGTALRHARDYVLKHRNREHAGDMIWVLTDGKSKDEFRGVSEELRRDGVEIFALGISRTGEEEFLEHLIEMTGDEELVLNVEDVRDSFTKTLVARVSEKICEVGCNSD